MHTRSCNSHQATNRKTEYDFWNKNTTLLVKKVSRSPDQNKYAQFSLYKCKNETSTEILLIT